MQAVADFLGDSLALSVKAQSVDADIILFAGVHFMAETAKVLCPEKGADTLSRGGLLAGRVVRRRGIRGFQGTASRSYGGLLRQHHGRRQGPDGHLLHLVQRPESRGIDPADQPVIFAPDRNLGSYIQKLTGRQNMVLWNGACHVHEEFSLEKLLKLKREHPEAKVVAHPECRAYILEAADYVGSTAGILEYCGRSDAQAFIVVTESGILAEMKSATPKKTFIPAPPDDETCACNNCRYMKMVTLENICACLENEAPRSSSTRRCAAAPSVRSGT